MSSRSDIDLSLWRQWDLGGRRPDDMEPLLDQFEPVIQSHLHKYTGKVNIPTPSIRADLENRFAQALGTFDPNKGVQLSTHVNWNLKGTHGFIVQNQNIGRIPENQIARLREYTTTVGQLQEDLGKMPDDTVVASKMHWSPTQVKRLRRSLRKDLSTSNFEVPIGGVTPTRWDAIKQLLPSELSPQERFVFKHTVGSKPMQAQAMARALRVSNAAVSRIRARVAKRIEEMGYLRSRGSGLLGSDLFDSTVDD